MNLVYHTFTKNSKSDIMVAMQQELSDQQLAIAAWLYEKRPLLKRVVASFCLGIAGIYFFFSVTLGILYIIRFANHQKALIINTQKLILEQDLVYKSFPKPPVTDAINVVRHQGRGADFLVLLENPNQTWVASSYDYTFSVDGVDLPEMQSFALPGTHYLVGFRGTDEPFNDVKMKIENLKWRKVNQFIDQDRLKTFSIAIENSVFVPGDKKEVVDTVVANIKNNTPFGFWRGEVIVAVYKNKQLLAVGSTFFDQFKAGETHKIEVGLGILPVFQVDEIKFIPQINYLDDGNIFVL